MAEAMLKNKIGQLMATLDITRRLRLQGRTGDIEAIESCFDAGMNAVVDDRRLNALLLQHYREDEDPPVACTQMSSQTLSQVLPSPRPGSASPTAAGGGPSGCMSPTRQRPLRSATPGSPPTPRTPGGASPKTPDGARSAARTAMGLRNI